MHHRNCMSVLMQQTRQKMISCCHLQLEDNPRGQLNSSSSSSNIPWGCRGDVNTNPRGSAQNNSTV